MQCVPTIFCYHSLDQSLPLFLSLKNVGAPLKRRTDWGFSGVNLSCERWRFWVSARYLPDLKEVEIRITKLACFSYWNRQHKLKCYSFCIRLSLIGNQQVIGSPLQLAVYRPLTIWPLTIYSRNDHISEDHITRTECTVIMIKNIMFRTHYWSGFPAAVCLGFRSFVAHPCLPHFRENDLETHKECAIFPHSLRKEGFRDDWVSELHICTHHP